MLWVGMDGHRSLLMGMVWVWVQIQRKMLGSAGLCVSVHTKVTAINLIQKTQWIPRAPKDDSFLSFFLCLQLNLWRGEESRGEQGEEELSYQCPARFLGVMSTSYSFQLQPFTCCDRSSFSSIIVGIYIHTLF
jgi:hypothetical protein